MNMKPATALPWTVTPDPEAHDGEMDIVSAQGCPASEHWFIASTYGIDDEGDDSRRNAAYIAHAANAYPKLVEALRVAIKEADGWFDDSRGGPCEDVDSCRALLRELGETQP